jgi:hypothetical protein
MERKNVSCMREKIREKGYNGSDKINAIKVRKAKERKRRLLEEMQEEERKGKV